MEESSALSRRGPLNTVWKHVGRAGSSSNLRPYSNSSYREILFQILFTWKSTSHCPYVSLSAALSLLSVTRAEWRRHHMPEEPHVQHMILTFTRDLSRRTPQGTNHSDGWNHVSFVRSNRRHQRQCAFSDFLVVVASRYSMLRIPVDPVDPACLRYSTFTYARSIQVADVMLEHLFTLLMLKLMLLAQRLLVVKQLLFKYIFI